MLNSDTDICNLALAHLGEKRILSLDDDTTAGRACNLLYSGARDELLREHRWNFATTRITLTQDEDAPLFGWEYQYTLPADCLRVLEVNGSEHGDIVSNPWKVEGRKLLSNDTGVNLIYVSQVTNVSLYDTLFAEALALRIAIKLSEAIRGTTGKTGELFQMLEAKLAPLSRRIDSNEKGTRRAQLGTNSRLVGSRRGGRLGSFGAAYGDGGGGGAPGPVGPQGPQGEQGEDGSGLNYRSAYSALTNYLEKDVVLYGSVLYYAPQDIPVSDGDTPGTPGSNWDILLPAGATGAQGPEGPQGPAGPQGIEGNDGTNGANGAPGADGADGKDHIDSVVDETTTARTLALSDDRKYISLTNASSCTITIPTNATTDFQSTSAPFIVYFRVEGAAAPTLSNAGVTVNDQLGVIAALATGQTFALINKATDEWDVI